MQTAGSEPGSAPLPQSDLHVDLRESRYDRQERVSWWDQNRLTGARVLVVGAGALGNEVVKNLALIGIGDIVVIDLDVVEVSNLARCIFFRSEDEGMPKASVLAKRASEINPDISISAIVGDVRSLGTGTWLRADVVIGALDNREARLYCNRLAARTGRAWIDGAIEALSGVARVFEPPAVCYECTLTDADWDVLAHRQSCRLLSRDDLESGKVPTTASTSSIVAAIEVQEALKLLHRDLPGVNPLRGAIVFDGANNDAYPLTYPENPDCMAHHHYVNPIRMNPTSDPITASALVAAAFPQNSNDATESYVVDLGDDQVIAWTCTHCNVTEPEGRPAQLIAWGDALCRECGDARQPAFVTSIDVPGPHSATDLAEFGIRTDEILPIRQGLHERYVWIDRRDPRFPETWSSTMREPAKSAGGSTSTDD
jgi:molybdopterin/thiamine biosynthesis adenylyltransferase